MVDGSDAVGGSGGVMGIYIYSEFLLHPTTHGRRGRGGERQSEKERVGERGVRNSGAGRGGE